MALSNCKTCRETYKEYNKEGFEIEPPCERCFPSIHPYNRATYEVYVHCSGQLILGMSGAISVNILSIDLIIDRLNQSGVTDIEDGDRLDIYSDVNKLFSTIKEVISRKQKQEAAKTKGKNTPNRRRR
jgi:hypothetical protein